MKKRQFFLIITTILLHITCITLGLLEITDLNIVLNIISAILMICSIYSLTGSFSNVVFLFVVFSVMYGLGGPITVRYGEGLSSIFGTQFYIDKFLMAYDLATIGLLMGISFYNVLKKDNNLDVDKKQISINEQKIINISLFASLLTSVFEIMNFIRVGGLDTLVQGKAVYQAAISTLSIAMPVDMVACLGVGLITFYISLCRKNKKKISKSKTILFLFMMLPYLIIELLLGKRGRLLAIVLVAFLGFTYFTPLKKISKNIIIIAVVVYMVMVFLYANRAIVVLLFKNPDEFVKQAFSAERIVTALNPRWRRIRSTFWKLQCINGKRRL